MTRDRRTRLLGLLLTLSLTLTAACGGQATEQHSLWRVTTPRAEIYLLGSVHVLRESDYPLPEAFTRAWDATDVLVLELRPDAFSSGQVTRMLQERASLPSGVTLADIVGDESWQQARDLADETEVDLLSVARFEPWFAAVMVMNVSLSRAGFEAALGVDQHFAARAADQGRDVWALETPEDQVKIFDTMPLELQERFLIMTLEESDQAGKQTDQLLRAWRAGDAARLEEILGQGFEDFPALFDQLVSERNDAWFETLETWAADGEDMLVVVGALHLVGEDGLVRRFRDAGYAVEQL